MQHTITYNGITEELHERKCKLFITLKSIAVFSQYTDPGGVGKSILVSNEQKKAVFRDNEGLRFAFVEAEKNNEFIGFYNGGKRRLAISYDGLVFLSKRLKEIGLDIAKKGKTGRVIEFLLKKENWPNLEKNEEKHFREGLNRVFLIGFTGESSGIKHTQSGRPVLNFRIATTERYKDIDGEWKPRTDWHTVVVWGERAKGLDKVLTKNTLLSIEGRLQTRFWDDKNGIKCYTTEVVAREVLLLRKAEE